jgi:hypothetical protein
LRVIVVIAWCSWPAVGNILLIPRSVSLELGIMAKLHCKSCTRRDHFCFSLRIIGGTPLYDFVGGSAVDGRSLNRGTMSEEQPISYSTVSCKAFVEFSESLMIFGLPSALMGKLITILTINNIFFFYFYYWIYFYFSSCCC